MADPGAGAPLSRIAISSGDKRIDRRFFQRMFALVRPFWWRRGSVRQWVLLAGTFAVSTAIGLFQGNMTSITADQSNALVARNAPTFWTFSAMIVAMMAGSAVVGWIGNVAQAYIVIDWRRWLTNHLAGRYLSSRTYYEITIDADIDNPDQRIQEEVGPVCETLLGLPRAIYGLTFAVGVQVTILSGISATMTAALLAFLAMRFLLTFYIYRPGIAIAWDTKIAEAELRYGILHVRDNAETIAFYRGEAAERQQIAARLTYAVRQMFRNVKNDVFVQSFDVLFQIAQFVLPLLLVVPLYFSGHIPFGAIAAAGVAATLIQSSIEQLTNLIPGVIQIVPNIVRLAQIEEKAAAVEERLRTGAAKPGQEAIEVRRSGDDIRLTNVSYLTPGGERSLAENISMHIRRGERLIIVGRTGVGKSSLMRVLAGLWTRGHGVLDAPALDRTLFMPQRPYMMLGSLRSQLLYPGGQRDIDDASLLDALDRAKLGGLAERHGGLDAERDWGRILSLGEQQRMAFARFLAHRPDHVFLDEATSAVDLTTEAHLYGLLIDAQVTVVSVAHRTSVLAFHDLVLDLREDGWSLDRRSMPHGEDEERLDLPFSHISETHA